MTLKRKDFLGMQLRTILVLKQKLTKNRQHFRTKQIV